MRTQFRPSIYDVLIREAEVELAVLLLALFWRQILLILLGTLAVIFAVEHPWVAGALALTAVVVVGLALSSSKRAS